MVRHLSSVYGKKEYNTINIWYVLYLYTELQSSICKIFILMIPHYFNFLSSYIKFNLLYFKNRIFKYILATHNI